MPTLVESIAVEPVQGQLTLAEAARNIPELYEYLRNINEIVAMPDSAAKKERFAQAKEALINLRSRFSFDQAYAGTQAQRLSAQVALRAADIIQAKVIDATTIGDVEKGSKNLDLFFTRVLGVAEWEKLPASVKVGKIWEYVHDFVILAQSTEKSPWMNPNLVGKVIEGLPDQATVEMLIASVRLLGGEHIDLADRLEIDLYKIQKIFRIGYGLQNIQKDMKGLAEFFRNKENLFSSEDHRQISGMGEGYTDPPLGVHFVRALQAMHALCRPDWTEVYVEGFDGVRQYPVSSEFSWWPQTVGKNPETRMQVRRAVGAAMQPGTDPQLEAIFDIPYTEPKLAALKQNLGGKIKAMKRFAEQSGKVGEIVYSLDPAEQKAQKKIEGKGQLFEMLATNFLEGNLVSPGYDAGAKVQPGPGGTIPVLENIDGFTATFVPTKARYLDFYRRKLRKGGGGEGTPGPEATDGDFPSTGRSHLEYFYCKTAPVPGQLDSTGVTLLDALMWVRSLKDYQSIFSVNNFGNMDETSQGTAEVFFGFFESIIELGIPWKDIKRFVPGSGGAAVEFSPEVGKKLQKLARDIYYLLTRQQMVELSRILEDKDPDNPNAKLFTSIDQYAQYTRYESQYRAAVNKGAFLAGLGASKTWFEKRYKKLNALPAKGFRLHDGFKEEQEDSRYMRFAARFFNEMVNVPRRPDGKLDVDKLDIFEKEIFFPKSRLPVDYFLAMQKLYMGKLIIGDIVGHGQQENIDFEDARAILGILVRDWWEAEIKSPTARIRTALRGVSGQTHSYEGWGKFTYDEAMAILKLAGVPTGVLARVRSAYQTIAAKTT